MATVEYEKIDNLCFNDTLGSIFVDQINLSGTFEQENFSDFIIQWSGDFDSGSQISSDGRIAEFLKNGNYSFNIVSTIGPYNIGPYNIEITSPPELKITNVKYTKYACSIDGGSATVFISGGLPPYNVVVGSIAVVSSGSIASISGIIPGDARVIVSDANNCSYEYDQDIQILDSTMNAVVTEVIPPTLRDSYATIKMTITGYGPFNIWFTNLYTNEITYIDSLYTEYLSKIISETEYRYIIRDKLVPGEYSISIKNNFGCSFLTSLVIPNTTPISVNCFIVNDDREIFVNKKLSLPIFDTILIPYKHIQQNTNLWQLIKTYNLKDNIVLTVDNKQKQYKIVRYMLDKYCLDENKIEILRLGNSPEDWFYFLYVAPSINLLINPNFVNLKYEIFNKQLNEGYPLTLGLTSEYEIDRENASLIKGSFLLDGLDHNQFVNSETYINFTDKKNNAYVSFENSVEDDHAFFIENVSKKVLKNMYTSGYITSINFLEQFNRLNTYININDTACSLSNKEYQYIQNIKELLRSINDLNNINNTYLYNIDNISKLGQISLSIDGQDSFLLEGGSIQLNQYDINYYFFDEHSASLSVFYQNNEPVKTNYIKNISDGYVIVRIKDIYNNIPKFLTFNNNTVNYDYHFASAKNIIQKFNRNITPLFLYGDILCYVGSKENPSPPIFDNTIPQAPELNEPNDPVEIQDIVVEQTKDISNTASLQISLYKEIACTLYGPKNYQYSFNTNITFTKMIPGVYRIVGNDKELFENNLYQQEFRIVIDKNTTNTIDIDFVSYKDKVFIKEIT